jgi:hypothetical protein
MASFFTAEYNIAHNTTFPFTFWSNDVKDTASHHGKEFFYVSIAPIVKEGHKNIVADRS